jgi:AraC-like DNA-binding protein
MTVNIEYKQPSGILQQYISHYIVTEVLIPDMNGESLNHLQISMPDGALEMHFSYSDTTVKFGFNNNDFHTYRSAIIGVNDLENALRQTSLRSSHKCIVVKFKYQGFYEIFGIPVSAFSDKIYETEDVLGSQVNRLHVQLDNAYNNEARIKYVEQFMMSRLKTGQKHSYRVDRCIKALGFINDCHGNLNLSALMEKLDISERPVQRDFKTIIGVSPKQFCKIIRFHNFMLSLNISAPYNGSDLVYRFGYYDQSHMIKEFKKATTMTPEWYLKNRGKKVFTIANMLIFPDDHQFNSKMCQNLVSEGGKNLPGFLK